MNQKIRCAVVGANRGRSFMNSAKVLSDHIELVALCDTREEALAPWREQGLRCYNNYEDLLTDAEVDAVCIATPVYLHAGQSIMALRAGKHVLSEVTAAFNMEDCWALIKAVEETGLTYMMAENYCFRRDVLAVQHMVEEGVFGDIVHATGSYIHDCRDLMFMEDGELTWRGNLRREPVGNSYPTHSLGPVARWLDINRTDFFTSTATWNSRTRAVPYYAARNSPNHPEYAQPEFWGHSDTVTSLLRTEKDILAEIRVDWCSARPHHMSRYELQGTKAAFTSCTQDHEGTLVWIEGSSKAKPSGTPMEWEPLGKYLDKYEHPLWREHLKEASGAGHGGGDYFTLMEFVNSIRENRMPLIDVYDAVTWSALTPLSMESITDNNNSVKYPRFKK